MHVAALISRLRQNLTQRRPQAGVIVGNDKFDAVQTALPQSEQEIAPARAALAVGQLNRQHLAAAIPVDVDEDELPDRSAGERGSASSPA